MERIYMGCLPAKFPVYPDLLEASGYKVGYSQKGWGPGEFKPCGRMRNPAGPHFENFAEFFKTVPEDEPFCFWFSSTDPHRPYAPGSGLRAGLDPGKVKVPPIWPDTPEVRSDILDYYFAVERFDRDCGEMLALLEKSGQLDNTIVVMTGDNGWPFPRCKANLYDGGTRQPLAVQWKAGFQGGRTLQDFVNLTDFAPTFLDAAGVKVPAEMTGRSLLRLLKDEEKPGTRKTVFLERERHCAVRPDVVGYPMRAVRTDEFLYIRNFHPERWPAGDGDPAYFQGPYGDVDQGGTKQALIAHAKEYPRLFELTFGKRPAEELYDVRKDPYNVHNLAAHPAFTAKKQEMSQTLSNWMRQTSDPRSTGDGPWDHYPYYGEIRKR
jgi:N-sulfoglucosamine sulfohydrolase